MAAATEYAEALAEGYVTAMPQRIFGIRYALMVGHFGRWSSHLIELTRAEEEQLAEATRKARAWWFLWRREATGDIETELRARGMDEVSIFRKIETATIRAEQRLLRAAMAKRGRTLH